MILDRRSYVWFYDHIHCHYYSLLMKYCFLPFGGERRCRRRLIEEIDFNRDDAIVDLCCGCGGSTAAIAERIGPEGAIIGLDLSAGQIRMAMRRSPFAATSFLIGDAAAVPLPDRSCDKALVAHALHEMQQRERLEVLRETFRLLKPGGRLIVLEVDRPKALWLRIFIGFWFFYWLPFNFETPTRRDLLRRSLVSEMADAGFSEVQKRSKYGGVFQVVDGVKHRGDYRGGIPDVRQQSLRSTLFRQ